MITNTTAAVTETNSKRKRNQHIARSNNIWGFGFSLLFGRKNNVLAPPRELFLRRVHKHPGISGLPISVFAFRKHDKNIFYEEIAKRTDNNDRRKKNRSVHSSIPHDYFFLYSTSAQVNFYTSLITRQLKYIISFVLI